MRRRVEHEERGQKIDNECIVVVLQELKKPHWSTKSSPLLSAIQASRLLIDVSIID